MTELQRLKNLKKAGKASQVQLDRLKQLQDGEPLSAKDLAAAQQRETERAAKDKAEYDAKHKSETTEEHTLPQDTDLDVPAEHPRIAKLKQALMPFTQIEAHNSRPDEFVLFTRGISITAGDVRAARQAMKL